jgi:hypothetical protein
MRVREGLGLIRSSSGRRSLWRNACERLYTRRESVGLRRDLSVPFAAPPAKIPLIVRPLRPDDDLSFIAELPDLAPQAVRDRLDRRHLGTGDLERLSAHHRRLRPPRPPSRQDHDERDHQLAAPRCARRNSRNWHNWAAPCTAAATTSWPSSSTTPPAAPPKPSTDASKPCAATPSASETSPTTAGAHYCTAAYSTNLSMHSELRRAGFAPTTMLQPGSCSPRC